MFCKICKVKLSIFYYICAMQIFNNILETIGNTPIVKLNKITAHIPATVCVKIESFNQVIPLKTEWR